MTRKVLVTGVSGFAGKYLADHLTSCGYEVFGTTHHGSVKRAAIKGVFQLDLRSFDDVKAVVDQVRPEHVVHLAAISFVGHGNISEIYETNIVGARNLLRTLEQTPTRPRSVVLTSSANIYGNSDRGQLAETEPARPENDYAVSKIAMEYMSAQFSKTLDIIIARPFNYTGRGQAASFLVPKIVNHFRDGVDAIELGNTDVSRDFSDVRVVVQYMRRLMETPQASGQAYNICTGRPTSLKAIIETCERITGRQIAIRINPKFVRNNEIKVLVGDQQKLLGAVGRVEDIPIEATLAWMLEA